MTMPRFLAAALLLLATAFVAIDSTPAAVRVLRIGLADDILVCRFRERGVRRHNRFRCRWVAG
jgi:hypothetical protein